jgi:hypothetical protein
MLRRTLPAVLTVVVLLSVLTACGGAGSGAIERPSLSPTFSPTVGRPTPTRTPEPPRTSSAPVDPPTTTDAAETSAPATTAAPTAAAPTETPPATSEAPATSAPAETPSAAPEESAPAQEQTSAGDGWWWLLIVVLVAGAAVTWLLLRHARSRRAWEARLAAAEREAGWFARDLIPQLRGSGSPAGVAGGWSVGAPRVAALDDQLSQLVTTAPGDEDRARASALQAAVRNARERVLVVLNAGGHHRDQWVLDLDDAQAPLLAVLVPPPASSTGAHSAG